MDHMQAVILAGGKGTRLAERLNGRPKPLVDVCGVPLLKRQVDQLASYGVTEAIVLVNHKAEQIEAFFAENPSDLKVTLIDDGEPRGTAGAVLACLERLAERFLVVYGDTLFDIDITAFLAAHEAAGAQATLLLHPNDHPVDSDLVEVDEEGRILAFHGYPHPPGKHLPNLVNAAFYVVERAGLERYREAEPPLDFAKDLFPRMLAEGASLHGYRSFEYIKDLGTPKRLDKVEKHLRTGVVERARRSHPQTAVFLDRDGTLNQLRDYVRTPEDLELIPSAAQAVKRLNDAELRVVVITNQPVLARGECTHEGLRAIHAKLDTELGHAGAYVDALYFCPHHPHSGFPGEVAALKVDCDCRKPKDGMIRKAAAELNIDLARSWMIGDSTSDVLAAQRAGVRSILVETGEGGRDGRYPAEPDFSARDVAEAVEFITSLYPAIAERLSAFAAGVKPGDLVLVGGFSRAGKSTISGALAAHLREAGVPAQRLGLDRWILSSDQRQPGFEGRHDMDSPVWALEPWLKGGNASFTAPRYERQTRTSRPGAPVEIAAGEALVLEGVTAFALPLQTDRRVHRLFVESDERARRRRILDDLIARGASASEAERIYEERRADENPAIQRARAAADHVISLDELFAASLETA